MKRNISDLHIGFLNPQGNFDPRDSYWTEHPDFGGQLVYVKEISLAMAKMGVKVDILTRQIIDNNWPEFRAKIDYYPGCENVRILRLPFGGNKFLPKEQLWPHLRIYVEEIIDFYQQEGSFPDAFTSHYGDGGLAGVMLAEREKIPFTFTAHSLGAQKMDKLNNKDADFEQLNQRFNFDKRIIAERLAMDRAGKIIVSTDQERQEQYGHKLYQGAVNVSNRDKFTVIPPGVNTEIFNGKYRPSTARKIDNYLTRDLRKERIEFPAIISSSRLDQKKNHEKLVKAYAGNNRLQKKANLVITLRGIENPFQSYEQANKEEKYILDRITKIIYNHDLEGKISMFPLQSQQELAEFYGFMAEKKSVFTLTSFYEPFGLAPVEAMSAGLPAVVTNRGGPTEIMENGKYGILVNPENSGDIARGLLQMLKNSNWEKYHRLGRERVINYYTWQQAASGYLDVIKKLKKPTEKNCNLPLPDYYLNPAPKNEENLKRAFLYLLEKRI
ncbi:MAG: glycosyltransferase [Halanaerobiales bacterium]